MTRVISDFDGDELERLLIDVAVKTAEEKLTDVRCPEHGTYATVTLTGKSVSQLTFKIEACCQKLIDAVDAEMGAAEMGATDEP